MGTFEIFRDSSRFSDFLTIVIFFFFNRILDLVWFFLIFFGFFFSFFLLDFLDFFEFLDFFFYILKFCWNFFGLFWGFLDSFQSYYGYYLKLPRLLLESKNCKEKNGPKQHNKHFFTQKGKKACDDALCRS